jgi:hypothetical protein
LQCIRIVTVGNTPFAVVVFNLVLHLGTSRFAGSAK